MQDFMPLFVAHIEGLHRRVVQVLLDNTLQIQKDLECHFGGVGGVRAIRLTPEDFRVTIRDTGTELFVDVQVRLHYPHFSRALTYVFDPEKGSLQIPSVPIKTPQ